MKTATQGYTIRTLRDGDKVAEVSLTAEQFSEYEAASQQPEGAITVDDLQGIVEFATELSGKTVVWIE